MVGTKLGGDEDPVTARLVSDKKCGEFPGQGIQYRMIGKVTKALEQGNAIGLQGRGEERLFPPQ